MFIFFRIIPKKKFVLCLILMIVTSTSNAFTSWLFSDIIRSATRQENSKLITLMGISIIVYSFFLFFTYFETKMITELTFIFNTEIKKTVVKFLLYQPNNQVDLGKELSFMSTDLKLLEQNYLASFFQLFKFMATFSISLTVAVLYDVKMAFIFILFSLIPLVVPRMFEQPIKNASLKWSNNNAIFLAFFKETLSGISDIQQLSAQSFFYSKNDAQMENMEKLLKNMNFVTSIASATTTTLGTICFFFPIMLGGLFVSRGSLEIATLIGLIQLSNSIVNPLISGISLISTFHTVEPILSKLLEYSLFKPLDPQHIQNSTNDENKIICTDLEIYRDGSSLFEPLTTTITSGQKVVILGDSGVGKSTLLALIKDTTSINYTGEILVEKKDLLLIPQTPFLINRSLKDNICFGESFPDDLYKDILTKTGLQSLSGKLLNTYLGESGDNLSGGQKQRVVLARTLIRQPDLLLLDEFTSALDDQATQKIHDIIFSLPQTIIEVAHKLSPKDLERYDNIIELQSYNSI